MKNTRKFLSILLALILISSAFVGNLNVLAEEPTPIFVIDSKYNSNNVSLVTVNDNNLFDSAVLLNTELTTSLSMIYRENDATVFSVDGVVNWLKDEDATLRFWVKMPWRENTPALSIGIDLYMEYAIDGATKYPRTTQYTSLTADGLWHEVRMNASGFATNVFDAGIENPDITEFKNFNIRVRANKDSDVLTAGEGFYISAVELYDAPLTAEINDGNVEREYFLIDGGRKDSVTDVTVTKGGIAGNIKKNIGAKITRNETTNTFSGVRLFPYSKDLTIAEGETENELANWINTDGAEMRTFVKNDSDSEITFEIGLYAAVTYEGSSTWPQTFAKEPVVLPANSGWVELRYTAKDFGFYTEIINKFTLSTGYVTMNIRTVEGKFLQNTGDSLYVTPFEICNLDIVEGVTDCNTNYTRSAVFNDNYSWSTSSQFTRTYTDSSELPFFQKAVTFTANDTYSGGVCRLNAVVDNHVIAKNFADFAFNPDAQMRFWVKSSEDREFKLYLQQNNKDISATVCINGSDEWQEIVLSRSDFSTNSDFDTVLLSNITDTDMDIYCYINTTASNFNIGESLEVGGIMEIFSDKAYDKGDANRDNSVDVRDIVCAKKLISAWSTDIYTADIDNTRVLNATDLTYLRTWLLKRAWN